MVAYYNEINSRCAEWLRNLIKEGIIAHGEVDERDIRDVTPNDVMGYTQCHFFAGIGGWSIALRLAGWPDNRPAWTGSPPCQPFSLAGKGLGVKDERHLAPVWIELVRQCKPPVVFGEQVAAVVTKDQWLDSVFDALEDSGYSCGAAVVPACSVGAPHIRQRVWFVAERLADSYCARREDIERRTGQTTKEKSEPYRDVARMGDGSGNRREKGRKATEAVGHRCSVVPAGWDDCEWILCQDGKTRPVEPGVYPLAYGLQSPSPAIAPYGNAIVPQVAAEFISAYMDI